MKCKRFSCFRDHAHKVREFKGIGLNYNRSTILKTFDSKSMRVLVILLIVLVCLSKPVCGELKRVRWEALSEHLAEESTLLLDLNVCDCPENIEDLEPSRVVAQFIENTFYLWDEYEVVTDDGVTSLCIIMKKPKAAPLSAEEAQVLLTASSLWTESEPRPEDMIILDPSDPRLNLQPIERSLSDRQSFRPKAVFGADDRTRVTDTTSYPWNTHCYIELHFPSPLPDEWYRGTGCIVGPYMVLTTGHSVYNREWGVFVDRLTVAPGQTQEYEGDLVIRPYGTRDGTYFRTDPSYHTAPDNNEKFKYDYGAVLFDAPLSSIKTYLPVEFSANLSVGDILYSAGYPGEVNAETNSKALWEASGSIDFIDEGKLLWYKIDTTSSQSGSPLRKKNGPLDPGRIVGIHASGGTLNNGPRLGAHNQARITEWMQWTPEDSKEYSSHDVPKTIPGLGTTTSTLTITETDVIADLDVKLNISHRWDANLDVYLIAPDGTRIPLFTEVGGSGNDFKDTVLDDEALLSITEGSAPFTGSYRPEGNLSVLDGKDINGTWTLEVTDDTRFFSGTLNSWSLIIETHHVIFEASFPSTTIDLNKWTVVDGATIDDVGIDEPSPEYSLRLNSDDSVKSKVIDLSSYSNATLTYYYQRTGGGNSPENGDDLIIEYEAILTLTASPVLPDPLVPQGPPVLVSAPWIELARHRGDGHDMTSYQPNTITLPPDALHSQFRLRFKTSCDSLYDDWLVDDVKIEVTDGAPPNVLICGANNDNFLGDIQQKLQGTGQFVAVDILDVSDVTPTLEELQAFDSVLVHGNFRYQNAMALGNVMANYVDSGGGVVCMMFEVGLDDSYGTMMMQGRWSSEEYYAIPRGSHENGPRANLGTVHDPGHPIMQGVLSFDGGSSSFRPSTYNITLGSVRVADWSDGRPLVVTKTIGSARRVDLAFYPVSSDVLSNSWDSSTDGTLLMANALTWVALAE